MKHNWSNQRRRWF